VTKPTLNPWSEIKQDYDEIDNLPLTDSIKAGLFQMIISTQEWAGRLLRTFGREDKAPREAINEDNIS